MFIWYWTAAFPMRGCGQFDHTSYAWTEGDYVNYCIVMPSDCCLMVPPETWNCE